MAGHPSGCHYAGYKLPCCINRVVHESAARNGGRGQKLERRAWCANIRKAVGTPPPSLEMASDVFFMLIYLARLIWTRWAPLWRHPRSAWTPLLRPHQRRTAERIPSCSGGTGLRRARRGKVTKVRPGCRSELELYYIRLRRTARRRRARARDVCAYRAPSHLATADEMRFEYKNCEQEMDSR